MPFIRPAQSSDAQRLAILAEETFRDTFESVNTVENMTAHCQASYGEAVQSAEISDREMVTLVCEEEENLVAFAQLRWAVAPECVTAERPGEIQRLYVTRSWHGRGIAAELMAACLEEMKSRNSDVAWLGVWERNPRAIAFYRKFGFVEVGEQVFTLGSDSQRDIIMVRPLLRIPPSPLIFFLVRSGSRV